MNRKEFIELFKGLVNVQLTVTNIRENNICQCWYDKTKNIFITITREMFDVGTMRLLDIADVNNAGDYRLFYMRYQNNTTNGEAPVSEDWTRKFVSYTGTEAQIKYIEILESDFYETIKNLSLTDKLNAIKNMENIPISLTPEKNNTYKGTPHSLSFGFEIEFKESGKEKNDIFKMEALQTEFDVDGQEKKTVDIDIGNGNIVTITKDRYGCEDDVIRIYHDRSIGYELVTRPFYMNEIEDKLKVIYKKINNVLIPDFNSPFAGGHITIMEGNHLNKKMNPLVVKNVIQLCRAFYPQFVLLSSPLLTFRGTKFYKLPTRDEVKTMDYVVKYSSINKRIQNGDCYGIEARFFCSPNNWKTAENNSKIIYAIWKTAEKISKTGSNITIKQNIIDKNKVIVDDFNDSSQLYRKKSLISSNPHIPILTKTFISLIETEARKLGILSEIKQRLLISDDNGELDASCNVSEQVEENAAKDAMDMLIKGYKREEIIEELTKRYKVTSDFISRLI